jgi:hypothetical protein
VGREAADETGHKSTSKPPLFRPSANDLVFDKKQLTRFALTVVLSEHFCIPRERGTDRLAMADVVYGQPVAELKKKPKEVAAKTKSFTLVSHEYA